MLYTVFDNLNIKMILHTKFNDEHILDILPEERKLIVCDSNRIRIVLQGNITSDAV